MHGKTIVVSGSSGLIGTQVVERLAPLGANLVLVDNDVKKLNAQVESIKKRFDVFCQPESDISMLSEESVESLVSRVISSTGRIDGLVVSHYPRTSDWSHKLGEVKIDSFCKNLGMHLGGYFHIAQKIAFQMAKKDGGSIVFMNSIYGLKGPDFSVYEGTQMTMPVAYSAIKGGVSNLTRYLASYFGPKKVRFNSVCAGGVANSQEATFVANYCQKTPLGRMAKAHEIADAVVFLLDSKSSYITGVNLPVDGGWTSV